MDDIVIQAMAKWPNVPACYGWLALDRRGQWWLRDAATQAAGPFSGPGSHADSKGRKVDHDKLREFIERNYDVDDRGCWFFQNGPQRVFVELEVSPWVYRIGPDGQVHTHTGQMVQVKSAWLDEEGRLYLHTDRGLGLVHSQDVHLGADRIESGEWAMESCSQEELPRRFGFVSSPASLFN